MLCRTLEVSRSGYYAYLAKKPSVRHKRNQVLAKDLLCLHEKYPALGLNSLYHLLQPQHHCSRGRVHRLMKSLHIFSIRKNAFKITTNSNHNHRIAPNILARNFSFPQPNLAWVGDITYIRTQEGWLYLAVIKDLCTRKIVGYAFSNTIDTKLALAALEMAVQRERPGKGLIFHSDRGVQYAACAFRKKLADCNMVQSMSRKGDPYDNAVAENFFSCLKCELVHHRNFTSRHNAQLDIFYYIEAFYNAVRPHSALGWIAPNCFAKRFAATCAA